MRPISSCQSRSPRVRYQGTGLCVGCGWLVRLGQVVVTSAPTVSCDGRRGTGRWPTGVRTGPCPAAEPLPVPTGGRSGGVGSSRTLAWPAPSTPRRHKPRVSSLMKEGSVQVLGLDLDQPSRARQHRSSYTGKSAVRPDARCMRQISTPPSNLVRYLAKSAVHCFTLINPMICSKRLAKPSLVGVAERVNLDESLSGIYPADVTSFLVSTCELSPASAFHSIYADSTLGI